MSVTIRPIEDEDREAVRELLTNRWAGPEILLDDEMVDASKLPGFVALAEGELVGDRHDLVRDDNGDAEGLGDLLELGQITVQRLLALGQVASTLILGAEVRQLPGSF